MGYLTQDSDLDQSIIMNYECADFTVRTTFNLNVWQP